MIITPFAIADWIAAIFIGSLGLVIHLGSGKKSSRAFALSMMSATGWTICVGLLTTMPTFQGAAIILKILYVFASAIALSLFYFGLTFPDNTEPRKIYTWGIAAIQCVLWYFFIFSGDIIGKPIFVGGAQRWGWEYGHLWFLFDIAFDFFFMGGLFFILRTFWRGNHQSLLKKNALYLFCALVIGVVPATITNIILPEYGVYAWDWFGPLPAVIWVSVIGYSIIKYHQLEVKAVVSEVLLLSMGLILFLNIFTDFSGGIYGRAVVFGLFCLIAFFFMRSILRESVQRESLRTLNDSLNDLNQNLQQKVDEQTKEVREAYEIEKKAREELQGLNESKNQFILLAQHHLRTPLTTLAWRIDSLLKGDDGPLPDPIRQEILGANAATEQLKHLIDTLLNITLFQAGKGTFTKQNANLLPLVDQALTELQANIEQAQIVVTCDRNPANWPEVYVDVEKMKEVFFIVLQNSVWYNHTGGSVTIESKVGEDLEIRIIDTGIGILKNEQNQIFTELFRRGTLAQKKDVNGRGISLPVAKLYVEMHGGNILLESEGEDKGTTVVIRLPLGKPNQPAKKDTQ